MKEKILIIEDEEKIVKILKLYLEKEGFNVDFALDGKEGFEKALINDYDIIILDLMLPNKTGEEIIEDLREVKDIPVLMLTAKDKESDRINGLKLGADDYVVKPFSPKEVVLRVKAILRRTYDRKDSKILKYKDITLNPEKFEVKVDNNPVVLTKVEFLILQKFLMYPERVFDRKTLLESIYEDNFIASSDRTIDAHIKNIRKKIKRDYIKTIYGVGYKLD